MSIEGSVDEEESNTAHFARTQLYRHARCVFMADLEIAEAGQTGEKHELPE